MHLETLDLFFVSLSIQRYRMRDMRRSSLYIEINIQVHKRCELSKQSVTSHFYNICTTSAQRLRRWSNIVQMLYKWFVFTGVTSHNVEHTAASISSVAECRNDLRDISPRLCPLNISKGVTKYHAHVAT